MLTVLIVLLNLRRIFMGLNLISTFVGLYVAMASLPNNSQQPSTILDHQPSEQQQTQIKDKENTQIAQISINCDYLRQAFKASGIPISDENTLATLISGKAIRFSDEFANQLYTDLSGKQQPSYVDANQDYPNGMFWVDASQTQALAQPDNQNISLKSNKKLIAAGGNYFPIFLKAKGHTCKFWIGLNGIKRTSY
jgi:ABC-type transporter MlaC component